MNFKRIREVRFVYHLYTIGSIVCVLFDRGRVCDKINSRVYLHSMAHERAFQLRYELSSLCKHRIRFAVNVKGTNNVINVRSDVDLSLARFFI